jgi:hypothetical protein
MPLVLLGVLAFSGWVAWTALAASRPPTPTITSSPANPTNATSATFTYSSSGATGFLCKLDSAASFTSCPTPGITYSGLAPGTHTLQVQAVDRTGHTSTAASYCWVIDRTPPTVSSIVRADVNPTNATRLRWTVTFSEPVRNVATSNFTPLVTSNVGGAAPTVTTVAPSGSAPSSTWTVTASTGSGTPGSGTLQLKLVRAGAINDLAGNALAGALPVNGETYTIDRLAPPVAFTTKPADPSSVSTSHFSWTSPASDVDRFECATENGPFSTQVTSQGGPAKPCVSPLTYAVATTNNGRHQFGLRAYDHVGNFTQITHGWKVAAGSIQEFSLSGSAVGLLYPGAPARPIALKLTNPNSVAILVTDAQVAVASSSSSAGCSPAANVAVTQSDVSATKPVQIAAGASVTLPAQGVAAPQIRMLNLSTNQDACKNATFSLAYNGSALSFNGSAHS